MSASGLRFRSGRNAWTIWIGSPERNVDLFGHVRKRILCIDIQVAHDSSVVDQYVAGWKVGSNPLLKRSDVVRIRSVALEGMHPWQVDFGSSEFLGVEPGNEDCVVPGDKLSCKFQADATCTPGD